REPLSETVLRRIIGLAKRGASAGGDKLGHGIMGSPETRGKELAGKPTDPKNLQLMQESISGAAARVQLPPEDKRDAFLHDIGGSAVATAVWAIVSPTHKLDAALDMFRATKDFVRHTILVPEELQKKRALFDAFVAAVDISILPTPGFN